LAAHSLPQGVGNFGNVDVRDPAPGTWTGVIFCDVASIGGTNGTVPWQVSTSRFVPFASVAPTSLSLAPGQSQTIRVTATAPMTAGDAAGSIILTSTGGGTDSNVGVERNSIPVTLRSLVNLASGGAFKGVLTGGNGRPNGQGQIEYYAFNVGPGHTSITANVSLTNDVADPVGAYLISPDGTARGFGQNSVNGVSSKGLTAYSLNPKAGTWTLIVDFAEPVVGNEISQPFSGNIRLDNVSVSVAFPTPERNAVFAAGVPLTAPVTITNNGVAPQAFFVDSRLNTTTSIALAALNPPPSSAGYPMPLAGGGPEWLVPTQTSSVQAAAAATLPIVFDYGPTQGDPDLFGPPSGTNAAASAFTPTGGTIQPGLWFGEPSEIGPYPGPAPSGFVNMSLTATTKAFDPAITSTTGDLWLAAADLSTLDHFAPIIIGPGQSAVINVTLTPAGASGTRVSGNLYVDTFVGSVPPYGATTGNEIFAIPYSYTIK
jgi:hypothetical protein